MALDRVLRDHLPLVYNVAARTLPAADADDVTQETMVRALAGLPRLRDPGKFRSWLLAIAIRETRRRGTRLGADQQRVTFAGTDDTAPADVSVEDHAVERLEAARQRRGLAAATAWLDPADRELLTLWWLTQVGAMQSTDVAAALGISAAHTRVRLQRLRARLQAARLLTEAVSAAGTPQGCPQLRGLLPSWDGRPAPVWRKRLSRHVEGCPRCRVLLPSLLPPERLLLGVPLLIPPASLPDAVGARCGTALASSAAPRHIGWKGAVSGGAVLAFAVAMGLLVDDRTPDPPVITAPSVSAPARAPASPTASSAATRGASPTASAPPAGVGAGSGGPNWSARQLPPTNGGRYLYVSGRGDDRRTGRSRGDALRTLRRAAQLTGPGDTVLVDDGEYSEAGRNSVVTIERSGTPDKWITWAAYPGARPLVRASQWQGIWVHASYITVSGFTITGMRTELTKRQIEAAKNGDVSDPAVSNSCIAVSELRNAARPRPPKHVVLWGNTLTDCTLAGISVQFADHVTAAYNVTSRNGWYSPYGGSGISFSSLWNSDDRTDYKMIIRGNVTSANQNLVPCLCSGSARRITDGNGIIVESLNNDDSRSAPMFQQPYQGRVLIENNVAHRNGGRGINVFDGAHVDVVNNTLYRNAAHPSITGDLVVTRARDVRVVNNIVDPAAEGQAAAVSGSSQVSFNHNLLTGTTFGLRDPALVTASPGFRDPQNGDFRLRSGSPAVDTATTELAARIDADRLPRDRPMDRGAFELR
ncbi:RNA polymerase sigma factor (sigma-70 family) [Krasilnikovia cinnamomea]|uniref:RNA polymerase sigma factor n=1 Tax=Krasilnikovia cinnamomea TaxID=349313 RepID=A0A4Q7ZQP1_9ACTN|nr:sigma-70 family RNA polymerase sigma factor [Krasilnikovia cinnamomea]RZU53427.1 RNA polymerase sigma factor (sigma-70 family) [Krasilnikovia cinnamomea]